MEEIYPFDKKVKLERVKMNDERHKNKLQETLDGHADNVSKMGQQIRFRETSNEIYVTKDGNRIITNPDEIRLKVEDMVGKLGQEHLFVISNIMNIAKRLNKKLFLGFIDLRKAYDRVNRRKLWDKLRDTGVHEDVITIFQQLYKGHKRKVFTVGDGLSGWYLK